MKKPVTARLSLSSIDRLNRLKEEEGATQAFIIEKALEAYELSKSDHKKDFMDFWRKLNQIEKSLELKRDYHPDTGASVEEDEDPAIIDYLTEEERIIKAWYEKIWQEMRELPFFTEVLPPELDRD